ncbi:MAG: BREX-1 system adenine-specific DNA-methyltransferase PglX, partial [Cyanobacteria bacterium]|nr:BREX-1 system adenine-specific DNA-methyltransferase PglX [Cyanobacteria bacterium bin.275]
RKLDLLLNSQTPDTLSTFAKQIAELGEQEEENREQLLERVAYTWFNRLCALRYLDARGWHPFGCKVLMPAAEGETQPELLKLMRAGSMPPELKPITNEARLHGLLDGQIPPAMAGSDPQGEVYRELVLASCRSYHQLLPELFESLDDASELLLPDDLLSEGSIAGGFRSAISDEDCEDVEIIGWLYQFYISEKKDQVIGKVVKSEDIPAATQLFTPNWIVKYMVQNSLGATWVATYPDSPLKGEMEFYIEPAEQTPEVQAQLAGITPESLDPEALTLIDPACGSGHILVEAYDLLKAIYLERGYRQRDIPELILTKNLFGLDICPRAAQLASFSLLMKGREDDRRLLERCIQLNVMALQDSTGLNVELLAAAVDLSAAGVSRADLRMLAELFAHATTFGSLIQVPPLLAENLPALSRALEHTSQDLFTSGELQRLRILVRQARILAQRYDAVVANPPYMGSKGMNRLAKEFVKANYTNGKSDLFACFIERGFTLAKEAGYNSMVTMETWMFLSSYEKFRSTLLSKHSLKSLAHFPYDGKRPTAMGINFGVAVINALNASLLGYKGHYCCSRYYELNDDGIPFQFPTKNERLAIAGIDSFTRIPGSPIAYWASESVKNLFDSCPRLESLGEPRRGLQPGDTPKHVRAWHEVSLGNTAFSIEADNVDKVTQKVKWVGFTSGGSYRKWAGNLSYLVNWHRRGYEIKHGHNPIVPSEHLYFMEAITWSMVGSGTPSFRRHPRGLIPGNAAPFAVIPSEHYDAIFASLNGKVTPLLLQILAPTMNFLTGDIANLPVLLSSECAARVPYLLKIAEDDWNAFERSWGFQCSPLLLHVAIEATKDVEATYSSWTSHNRGIILTTKRLEEANNALFISEFGLGDELDPDIQISEITLTINSSYRYEAALSDAERWIRFRRDTMAEFLSYATGCMMGRYSLDQPGLILADTRESQAAQLTAYEEKVGKHLSEVQFKPDPDGIIPVLDGEWFEDDIVARTREFLEVTFPESTVTENLRFIEESLGKDIRKYFCTEFYKDHLQTYKKRPIYWLVQSPKKGFSCLIYLHRYTKDTLNQVLNNYFRPYLQKLEARLAQLGLDQLNDDLPTRERTAARKEAEKITKVLKECQAWEQDALLPLAQQRIELDLDDGVKVNYLKLQDVLAPIPGLAAKED